MHASRIVALVVLVFSGGAVVAQEKVENPTYTSWAKFKKGTSITMTTSMKSAVVSNEGTVTTTLLEVTADKVVLEVVGVYKMMGTEVKKPPMKEVIERMVAPQTKKGAPGEKPGATTMEGTETLKVGGQEIKTKWIEHEGKDRRNNADIMKQWTSDDVPGLVVKYEMAAVEFGPFQIKQELSEIKKSQ